MGASGQGPRLLERTVILRRRLLPRPGKVMVRVGDRVAPTDVVAQALAPGQMAVVDLRRENTRGLDAPSRHLRVKVGDTVEREQTILARRLFGMTIARVASPCAGTIAGVHDEQVFILKPPRTVDVTAYVAGRVTEVYAHRGVSIESMGMLVSGIWSCGPDADGVLTVTVHSPKAPITWQRVGIHYRGTILVGGTLQDARVLYRAKQFRVHGIVVGSLAPSLQPVCQRLGLTVVITEGLGQMPMAEPVFAALYARHGRGAILGGAQTDAVGIAEVIIPDDEDQGQRTVSASQGLIPGSLVRLTRPPFLGTVSQVVSVPARPQRTQAGTLSQGAYVRDGEGQLRFVPLANLELLG